MVTIRFAPLLRSPKIPCVLMLNAASKMVGSQESEISTDGRTTAAVGDLRMYKIPLVYPPPKSEMTLCRVWRYTLLTLYDCTC